MKKELSGQCSTVKTTLEVIGGKWKPLILYFLKDKTLRFSELHRSVEGITQKMLTQELRELEEDDLIKRKVYPVVPPRVEYTITRFGKTLLPIFTLMDEWGSNYKKRLSK